MPRDPSAAGESDLSERAGVSVQTIKVAEKGGGKQQEIRQGSYMLIQKLLIVTALTIAATGCQISAAKPAETPAETLMEVEGVVEVLSGGHGLGYVTLDNGKCYDLALPAKVFKRSKHWDARRVQIIGSLQFRPRIEEMMWFDVKDRKIEGLGCSEDVIYVESIRML